MELIDIEKCCGVCSDGPADKVLVDRDGKIIGWYCDPCGATAKKFLEERRKPRARCHFNENSNRQCLLDDPHTGGHNLPCIESSAHRAHAKSSADADGNYYQCAGQRFDRT